MWHRRFSSVAGLVLTIGIVPACKEQDDGTSSSPPPSQPTETSNIPLEPQWPAVLSHFRRDHALIDLDRVLDGGPGKDGIPALTNPTRVAATESPLADEERIVEVVIDDVAVAYPISILNFHEIANDTVADVPIAVTYCPLCDSVAVFERWLTHANDDGTESVETLEFGVSGLLYNSNVVMYEQTTMSLWSQVYLQGITGPHSGRSVESLPVQMTTFGEFKSRHANGEVLSTETGHLRPYEMNPYRDYFLMKRPFHSFEYDNRVPPMELGLGIRVGDRTVFVTDASIKASDGAVIATEHGDVRVSTNPSGLWVESKPDDVAVIQTFYHSWAAYHPDTEVVGATAAIEDASESDGG